MLRLSLVFASTLLLCADASAQQTLQAKKTLGPTRNLGVYHVATGTFTRDAGHANISPDYIYRNDAPSGYFGVGWENCWSVEELILPGTGNPNGGPQDAYLIDGVSFAYCKTGAGTVTWFNGGYDSYVPCDDPSSPAGCICEVPGIVAIAGLPGGSACWILTIDLAGGYEYCIPADGGPCAPGYDGGGLNLDHAGYGFAYVTTDGGTTGPILNGDPNWKPFGDGTCYNPGFGNLCGATDATGLGQQDLFSISNHNGFPCGLANGCYFFGGYANNNGCGAGSGVPIAGFQTCMFADCTVTCEKDGDLGTVYCDATQNPNNAAGITISSLNSGDATIDVCITGGPPNQFCYLLVGNGNGTVSQPPGAKGDLCVVGGNCLGRYDKDIFQIDSTGGGCTDIKNPISNPCNGGVNIVPGASWNWQYWHRQPMGQPATFSAALATTFN